MEAPSFKWAYVMNYYDIPLYGICRVGDERLFANLENPTASPNEDLIYGIYRFPPAETEYFFENQREFERYVGTHWTYDEDGKRMVRYIPRTPEDLAKFYNRPRLFDFHEVRKRSECLYVHTVKREPED